MASSHHLHATFQQDCRPPTPLGTDTQDALATAAYRQHQSMRRRASRFCPDDHEAAAALQHAVDPVLISEAPQQDWSSWSQHPPDPNTALTLISCRKPKHPRSRSFADLLNTSDHIPCGLDSPPNSPHGTPPPGSPTGSNHRSAPLSPTASSSKSDSGTRTKHVTTLDPAQGARPPTPLCTGASDDVTAVATYHKHQSIRRRASRFAPDADHAAFLTDLECDPHPSLSGTAPAPAGGPGSGTQPDSKHNSPLQTGPSRHNASICLPQSLTHLDSLERLLLETKPSAAAPPALQARKSYHHAATTGPLSLPPALHCSPHRSHDEPRSSFTHASTLSPTSPTSSSAAGHSSHGARVHCFSDSSNPAPPRARLSALLSRELDQLAQADCLLSESSAGRFTQSLDSFTNLNAANASLSHLSTANGSLRASVGDGRGLLSSGFDQDSLSDFMTHTRL